MDVRVRALEDHDLVEADRIMRLAFGTFLGMPDPTQMFGDADIARTRFRADPSAALAAEVDGKLIGSNFVANWGSFGFFGPLSVDVSLWNKKVGQRLMEPTCELFEKWNCTHSGLFTFSHSAKHAALYQKFDFWPRFLTPIMSKQPGPAGTTVKFVRYSELNTAQKKEARAACCETTSKIYDGLDVSVEIRSVDQQGLGDTLLLFEDSKVSAFAICHVGKGSEAGSGACYVKFGAALPGPSVATNFEKLLDACESYAAAQGVNDLEMGTNMARQESYRILLGRGFKTFLQGVAMQKSDEAGYNRPGVFVLDDWR
jgi:predicted N-acetyltransferase YhbS